MKTTNFIGLALINLDSALLMGTVDDVWLDLTEFKMVALTLRSGDESWQSQMVLAEQVKEVGEDAITFTSAPLATCNYHQLKDGQNNYKLSDLINNYSVSSTVRAIRGKFSDVEIDCSTWTISAFIIEESGPFQNLKTIPSSPDMIFEPIMNGEFEHLISLNDN